jgi:LPS O-antigen subunit length determinant protein (WzzB/FepE family)
LVFRLFFAIIAITGFIKTSWNRKWTVAIMVVIYIIVAYINNFVMAADAMFSQPEKFFLQRQNSTQ